MVCVLKRVREAECVAQKIEGLVGEKAMEDTDETRFGISWRLKEDQYFDSGVCLDVLGLDFSFGLTGKVLVKLEELGSAIIRLKKEDPSHLICSTA